MIDWSARIFPSLPPTISQNLARLPFSVAVRDVVKNDYSRVDAIRVRLLFSLGIYAVYAFVLCLGAALVFSASLAKDTRQSWITLAAAALACGVWLGIQRMYRRNPQRFTPLHWERAIIGSSLLFGLVWVLHVLTCATEAIAGEFLLAVTVFASMAAINATIAPSWRAMLAIAAPAYLGLVIRHAMSPATLPWTIWLLTLSSAIGLALLFLGTHLATRRAIIRRVSNERSLAFQASVLQNGLLGILAVRNDKVVQCNAYFAELLGFPIAHIEGQSVRQLLISGDDETKLVAAMLAAEQSERTEPIELQMRRRDGDALWCSVQAQRAVVVHSSDLKPPSSDDAAPERSSLFFVVNIDQRKRSEARLFESERAYRGLVEASPSMIFAIDLEGRYVFINQRGASAILLEDADAMTGRSFANAFDPSTRARDRAKFSAVQRGENVLDYVCRLQRHDGSRIDVSFSVVPLFDLNGRVMGGQGTATDVTERAANAQALRLARDQAHDAMESITGACVLLDREERVVLCNRGFLAEFGQSAGGTAMMGRSFADLLAAYIDQGNLPPPPHYTRRQDWIDDILKRHRAHTPEVFLDKKGRWHQLAISPASNGGRLLLYTDITALKINEEQARSLANHDQLTGLPNRRLIDDRLERAMVQSRRMNQKVGVLVIDLDRFKPINDTYGHLAGDAVLIEVAKRFSIALRQGDTVGRYGGDEFLVVLNGLKSVDDVRVAGRKLLKALAAPIAYRDKRLSIGASIGAAVFPDHGQLTSVLIRRADTAMYGVKGSTRNAVGVCIVDALDRTISFTAPQAEPVITGPNETLDQSLAMRQSNRLDASQGAPAATQSTNAKTIPLPASDKP